MNEKKAEILPPWYWGAYLLERWGRKRSGASRTRLARRGIKKKQAGEGGESGWGRDDRQRRVFKTPKKGEIHDAIRLNGEEGRLLIRGLVKGDSNSRKVKLPQAGEKMLQAVGKKITE